MVRGSIDIYSHFIDTRLDSKIQTFLPAWVGVHHVDIVQHQWILDAIFTSSDNGSINLRPIEMAPRSVRGQSDGNSLWQHQKQNIWMRHLTI